MVVGVQDFNPFIETGRGRRGSGTTARIVPEFFGGRSCMMRWRFWQGGDRVDEQGVKKNGGQKNLLVIRIFPVNEFAPLRGHGFCVGTACVWRRRCQQAR